MNELLGSVWHQGTVYSVSAYVVPFLIELLAAQEVKDKPSIIVLLASIAGGHGYYEVHEPLFRTVPNWRPPEDIEAAKQEELKAVEAVRRAVSPILPDILRYLGHPDPEVRLSVAEALPVYAEHRSISKPALERARASESNEEVLQALDDALEALCRPPNMGTAPQRSPTISDAAHS
jgi:hypothetical protein